MHGGFCGGGKLGFPHRIKSGGGKVLVGSSKQYRAAQRLWGSLIQAGAQARELLYEAACFPSVTRTHRPASTDINGCQRIGVAVTEGTVNPSRHHAANTCAHTETQRHRETTGGTHTHTPCPSTRPCVPPSVTRSVPKCPSIRHSMLSRGMYRGGT